MRLISNQSWIKLFLILRPRIRNEKMDANALKYIMQEYVSI